MKTIIFYDLEATSVSRDADIISIGLVAVTKGVPCVTTDGCACLGWCKDRIKTFYAEFTDYNIEKCDIWVRENVIGKLPLANLKKTGDDITTQKIGNFFNIKCTGDTNHISIHLKQWLSQFDKPEFWADYDVIDKPMLIDLIADWNTSNSSSYLIDISAIPSNLNIEDVIKNWKKYSTITTAIKPQVTKNYKTGLPKHLPTINYYDFYDLHTLFLLKGIDPNINREDFAFSDGQGMSYHIEQIDKLGLTAVKHTAIWDAYVSYLCYEKLMKI